MGIYEINDWRNDSAVVVCARICRLANSWDAVGTAESVGTGCANSRRGDSAAIAENGAGSGGFGFTGNTGTCASAGLITI